MPYRRTSPRGVGTVLRDPIARGLVHTDIGGEMRLLVVTGERAGVEIPLEPGELTLGRVDGPGYLGDDSMISRVHVRLTVGADGTTTAMDPGSKNGTLLNGKRLIDAVRLRDGDELTVGRVVVRLVDDSPPPVDPDVTTVHPLMPGRNEAVGPPAASMMISPPPPGQAKSRRRGWSAVGIGLLVVVLGLASYLTWRSLSSESQAKSSPEVIAAVQSACEAYGLRFADVSPPESDTSASELGAFVQRGAQAAAPFEDTMRQLAADHPKDANLRGYIDVLAKGDALVLEAIAAGNRSDLGAVTALIDSGQQNAHKGDRVLAQIGVAHCPS